MDPDRTFAAVADRLLSEVGVSEGRMFGSRVLKTGGKVFAMVVKGKLVVKLPRERAELLLREGSAQPFDPGHGRPSKEWVALATGTSASWRKLAEEARSFVGGARAQAVRPGRGQTIEG